MFVELIPSVMVVSSCPNAHATLTDVNNSGCCYHLQLSLEPGSNYTAVETALITPGIQFDAIQYDLAGGWYYYYLTTQRLRWERTSGSLPVGSTPLFDFCISGDVSTEPAKIAVFWMVNNIRICSDTLELPCSRCLEIESESLTCLADSNSQYIFQFTNYAGFDVNSLRITEPPGQDWVVEDVISLEPVLPSGSSRTLSVTLRDAANGQASVCFEATSSRHLEGIGNIVCCTVEHCFEGPLCDRCCTDFAQFEADVASGFTVQENCESDSLVINGTKLSSCDRVEWRLLNLYSGMSIGGFAEGNIPVIFSFLGGTNYELCMTVTRQNASGMDCYQESTLTYCDTLSFDCPCVDSSHIDWNIDCPAELELVCGCDSMTYLNDCAALNWSGVESWTPGICHDPPAGFISLNVIAAGVNAQLDWTTGTGNVSYRFFIVQRRLSAGMWVTLTVVSGLTFSYLDEDTGPGLNEYRIVGVTYPGKPVFSNIDDFLITDTNEKPATGGWQIWPNPAQDVLYLQGQENGVVTVFVHSAIGRFMKQFTVNVDSEIPCKIDVNEWPSGLYCLWIMRENSVKHNLRAMIMR